MRYAMLCVSLCIITLSVQLVTGLGRARCQVVLGRFAEPKLRQVVMGSIVKFVKETYRTKTLWEAIKAGGYRAGYDGTVA